MWYQFFKYGLFVPVVHVAFHPWIKGNQNVPTTGGAILASNHLSAGDTFLLPAMMKRRMTFPAKAELFEGRGGPGSKVVAWFLKQVKMVPLDRSGGRTSADGLRPVLDKLAEGELIGIYPEGTRSPDGRLYKGKTGAARMALESGVPVIPVAMVGTEFERRGNGIPLMHRPGVIIGKPLDFSHLAGRSSEQRVVRYVTDEIMAAIQELSGQVYVDVYGSRVKDGDLQDADVSGYIRTRPGQGRALPPGL